MLCGKIKRCLLPAAGLAVLAAPAGAAEKPWAERSGAVGIVNEMPSGRLSKPELDKLVAAGEKLFTAKFTTVEGAGRPMATQAIIPTKRKAASSKMFNRLPGMDAAACSACHNEPTIGGAGDFVTNVFLSEGFNNADFDTTDPQFSNERGTNHLFGAGLIELLAREMSADLARQRKKALAAAANGNDPVRVRLASKGVGFGYLTAQPDGLVDLSEIEGLDADLVIRPFSQKGVMTSLRQFTVNAANHHHGMQAVERFSARWTGEEDFDEDGHSDEIGAADVSALVAWQATLPAPTIEQPKDAGWAAAARIGEENFTNFGCSNCHIKELPLKSLGFEDPGPFDVSGTLNATQVQQTATYDLALLQWAKDLRRNEQGDIMVPLFGDLKRHKMTDRQIETLGNELLSQRFVDRNIFMTSELWGIASTAPYGHRNDFTTLDAIIRAHGGDARKSRDAYVGSDDDGRSAIIAYLRTLTIKP